MSIAVNRSPNKLWRSTVTPYLTYAPKESGMWNVEKGQFCGFEIIHFKFVFDLSRTGSGSGFMVHQKIMGLTRGGKNKYWGAI
jgi:hypothetical protein